MAASDKLNGPVTPQQLLNMGPMRVRLISEGPYMGLSPTEIGEMNDNGADASGQQVLEEDSEGSSVNSSYTDDDISLLHGDVNKLIDDVQVQVQNIYETVNSSKNEMEKLTNKYNKVLKKMREMATFLELQFKTFLSVKSLKELNGMQVFLSEQELNQNECQKVNEYFSKEIIDLITRSLNTTRNDADSSNRAELAPNLAGNEQVSDQDEAELVEHMSDNINPAEQSGESVNTRPSTPTSRPNNIDRTEINNRKKNLIISNVPENSNGGDLAKIKQILKTIGCERLSQQVEKFSRLGEPRERAPRLLKLEMKSEEDVRVILANKEKLHDSQIPSVYINEDLSRAERAIAYHARVRKRSTAAEALEFSGREWDRNHSWGNFTQEYVHQRRPHTNNTGGMGGRGQRGNDRPHQSRHQTNETGSLPDGWEVKRDTSSGQIFYINNRTGDKQREFPTETVGNHSQGSDQMHREGYQGHNGRPRNGNHGHDYNGRSMGNYRDQGYPGYW